MKINKWLIGILLVISIMAMISIKKEATYSEFLAYKYDYLDGPLLFNRFINLSNEWIIPIMAGATVYHQNLSDNSGRCLLSSMDYLGASCGSTGGMFSMGNISWSFRTSPDSCGMRLKLADISAGKNGNIIVSLGTSCGQSDITMFEKRFEGAGGNCAIISQSIDIFNLQPDTTYYITLSTNKYSCLDESGTCLKYGSGVESYTSYVEIQNIIESPYCT